MKDFRTVLQNIDKSAIVIGEVAQAHDGSLGLAHAYIDAIAEAGADAVKFQTHIAAAESTPSEPWRVEFSQQDRTRFDYWHRMEFSEEQWAELKRHADRRGLMFLSSPFSNEAAELLQRVGIAAWKLASGEMNNTLLLDRVIESGTPVILSTGMSPLAEIDEAVSRIRAAELPLGVLQCTSMYPTTPEYVGLNLLAVFQKRYGCVTGLSDHSGTIYPCLAAAALGARIFEVHVTLSREMFGPDTGVSVTSQELRTVVEGVRFIEKAIENPVDKDALAEELCPVRSMFTKSIVAADYIPAGTTLTHHHVTVKKPGNGIPPNEIRNVIGRRTVRALQKDDLLSRTDLL